MPYYDHFGQLAPTGLGSRIVEIENKRLLGVMRRLNEQGETVLEIGPGRGAFAVACRESGLRYTGIEVNEALAKRLREQGFEVVQAFVPPLPIGLGKFDLVFCAHVIEHMATVVQARELLRNMSEATRPGGLVCVGAPDYPSHGVHFWHDYTHNFVTSGRRLRQMFVDEGITVLKELYHSGPFAGGAARLTSWMAKQFPSQLIGALVDPLVSSERIYKGKLTFLGRVFLIGCKP